MTKIIDGENAVLGRLAAYSAKEALKGEKVIVLNCNKIIITGSRKNIKEEFEKSRNRVGSGQGGPKISRLNDKIVKRTIRGMLPNHREGRGKIALGNIRCYVGIPKEFQDSQKIKMESEKNKFIFVGELSK